MSLVGFAAANAGNPAFAANFNRRVNARLMDFAFDRDTKVGNTSNAAYAAYQTAPSSLRVQSERLGLLFLHVFESDCMLGPGTCSRSRALYGGQFS